MSIRADVILVLSYYPVSSVVGWSETKTTEAKARNKAKPITAEIDFNEENGDNVTGMLRTAVIRRCVSTTASACGSNKEWKAMRTEEKAR